MNGILTRRFIVALGLVVSASVLHPAVAQERHTLYRLNEQVEAWICGNEATAARMDVAGEARSTYLSSAWIEPLVYRQGVDTYTLSVGVTDTSITSVKMSTPAWLGYGGVHVASVELHDDGSHGDETAGDRVFSLGGLTVLSDGIVGAGTLRYVDLTFTFSDGRRRTTFADLDVTARFIDPARVRIPPVARLAEDVQATEYAVNVVTPLAGAYPRFVANPAAVSTRYYDVYPDDRDVLILVYPFSTQGPAGSYRPVRNDVEGIGRGTWVNAGYGSAGRLTGLVQLYRHAGDLTTLNHELLHQTAVYLDRSLHLDLDAHWGPVEMTSSGFGQTLAGSDVVQLDDSTFRMKALSDLRYSALELYLMGLADLSEVSFPLRTLARPRFRAFEHRDGEGYRLWSADSLVEVSEAAFLEAHGPRVPLHPEAPSHFTAGVVVVYDRPLSDVEMAYFDVVAREYEKPSSTLETGLTFYEATSGRGTLSTRLPGSAVSVAPRPGVAATWRLEQNYPNPFNPSTRISYALPAPQHVALSVFDATGREVDVLADGVQPAGYHTVVCDAAGWPGGVYFYRLQTADFTETRAMVLMK